MIAWAAFVLALLAWLFLLGSFLLALSFWRKVKPSVEPLLTMFGPADQSAGWTDPDNPDRLQ